MELFPVLKTAFHDAETQDGPIEPKTSATDESVRSQSPQIVLACADVRTMFEPTDTKRNEQPR